jgi:hypothetical protein
VGYSLSVAPQIQQEDEDGAEHALRSSSLLRWEVSWARVSSLALRLERHNVVGACDIIAEVMWR